MAITIQIPPDIERELRQVDPQLDNSARDQFLVAHYQAGKLSTGDIAEILGFDTRFEAEEWLAAHGACQNYSLDDLEADRQTLDRILGPVQR
jgi:predicted HTH domain antitoxin